LLIEDVAKSVKTIAIKMNHTLKFNHELVTIRGKEKKKKTEKVLL
jgi:hypothetical protein